MHSEWSGWDDKCPNCGEDIYVRLGPSNDTWKCRVCGCKWDLTAEDKYKLNNPDPEIKELTRKLMKLSLDIALGKNEKNYCALASETSLAKDWLSPEEDEYWKDL